ncbi:hypothetical protein GA0115260_101137 [Streptomyces sp. MnatMP-M27]|nr:hypothetical protein GA0115260_101137 [Streptomyces sp. MnatMP-M27]
MPSRAAVSSDWRWEYDPDHAHVAGGIPAHVVAEVERLAGELVDLAGIVRSVQNGNSSHGEQVMAESTVSRSVSGAGSAAGRSDSPGVALGPIALVLGLFSAVGAWVPAFVLVSLPWTVIAGGLAVALGSMGVHHARRGIGRLWVAVGGTALGVVGFAGTAALLWAVGG